MSAWMPAPLPLSLPAMARTRGTYSGGQKGVLSAVVVVLGGGGGGGRRGC